MDKSQDTTNRERTRGGTHTKVKHERNRKMVTQEDTEQRKINFNLILSMGKQDGHNLDSDGHVEGVDEHEKR